MTHTLLIALLSGAAYFGGEQIGAATKTAAQKTAHKISVGIKERPLHIRSKQKSASKDVTRGNDTGESSKQSPEK